MYFHTNVSIDFNCRTRKHGVFGSLTRSGEGLASGSG